LTRISEADVAQRPYQHDEVTVERDEFTHRHPAVDDPVSTESENGNETE
jgi:hypothetical protein